MIADDPLTPKSVWLKIYHAKIYLIKSIFDSEIYDS